MSIQIIANKIIIWSFAKAGHFSTSWGQRDRKPESGTVMSKVHLSASRLMLYEWDSQDEYICELCEQKYNISISIFVNSKKPNLTCMVDLTFIV